MSRVDLPAERWLPFNNEELVYNYHPVICERLSGRHGTLADTGPTIHIRSAILVNTVPVDAGGLVAQMVVNGDDHPVSKPDTKFRTRPVSVDTNHRSWKPIGRGGHPANVPVVPDSLSEDERVEA